jgi:hypothetical protein
MSISTYAELQTAVGDWLHRSDLTARIPDFIKIGESRLNRELRLFAMENSATVSTSTSDRFATLPTGFTEAIDLTLYSDSYPQTLTQVSLAEVNMRATNVSTLPHYYAISSNIVFDVISDQVYTLALRYYKRLDIATDSTNTVLTINPDLYLYSALLAAAPYLKDDSRVTLWAQLIHDAIASANRQDARTRSKALLRTEATLTASKRGDIMTGDNW